MSTLSTGRRALCQRKCRCVGVWDVKMGHSITVSRSRPSKQTKRSDLFPFESSHHTFVASPFPSIVSTLPHLYLLCLTCLLVTLSRLMERANANADIRKPECAYYSVYIILESQRIQLLTMSKLSHCEQLKATICISPHPRQAEC